MELVGERFVRRTGDEWRDLATGDRVLVHVRPLPAAWCERQRHLAGGITRDGSMLVDFGRLGVDRWFEVHRSRAPRRRTTPVAPESAGRLARAATLALSSAATRHTTLVAVVDRGLDFDAMVEAIAARLRHAGIVAVRAGPFADAAILRTLEHRHLVVFAWTDHDRRALAAWTRPDRATGRPRVVIDLRRGPRGRHPRVSVSSIPEVQPMSLSELLSPVLEILHEAEDEAAALAAVARWLRRTAGAGAVAFVGASSPGPIAAM